MPAIPSITFDHCADHGQYALALLDLGRGHWNRALDRLDSLRDSSPLLVVVLADQVEAAARAGRRGDALTALERLETLAHASRSTWLRARLAGARALLAEGDAATVHFEEALRLARQLSPFDRARIQLLYGEHLRRARRRRAARLQLRSALETFEATDAGPWIERARAELRATAETARKRDPSTLDQLTPQQLQIARLVAEGLSNKEVASRFYLSPRTVENHLRSVFAKLGLSSRTQLARLIFHDGTHGAAMADSASNFAA